MVDGGGCRSRGCAADVAKPNNTTNIINGHHFSFGGEGQCQVMSQYFMQDGGRLYRAWCSPPKVFITEYQIAIQIYSGWKFVGS